MIQLPANEAPMNTALKDALRNAGVSRGRIESLSMSDRLLHDLGIYGEMADNLVEYLEKINVEMSDFPKWEFFPDEYTGKAVITQSILWFLRPFTWWYNDYTKFPPLTVSDLDRWIQQRRWDRAGFETSRI